MLVPYKIEIYLAGITTQLQMIVGRKVDAPLPADFTGDEVIGTILTPVPIVAWSKLFEYSASINAPKGKHYMIVGLRPPISFGGIFPYSFTVKYVVTLAGKAVEQVVQISQTPLAEQRPYFQVTFSTYDSTLVIENYGQIAPNQPAIEETGGASEAVAPELGFPTELVRDMMTLMMQMTMMIMMMNMMMGMMSAMAGAVG